MKKFSAIPVDSWKNPVPVRYSSIVDTSRFTSKDNDKHAAQNGVDSSSMQGLYDLDGTEKDKKAVDLKLPDMTLVALREGRLDRVEVEKIKSALIDENNRLSSENVSKAEAKKRRDQFNRQMDIIDQALGLKSETESDAQNLGKPTA